MKTNRVNRRELGLAAAVMGLGMSQASTAVAAGAAAADTKTYGQRHFRLVTDGLKTLGRHQAGSEQGVRQMIDYLRAQELVTEADADRLHSIVGEVVKDLMKARKSLEDWLESAQETGHEVLTAIASIVSESIHWCLETTKKLTPQQKTRIVLKDFSGAIQGAIAGIGFAAIAAFAGIPVPVLAAGFALAGAAASSLDAASDALKPEKT